MKEFLTKLAEASYHVALTLGFSGTFVSFLTDLEKALHDVIQKDKGIGRRGHKEEPVEKRTMH